jgi:hypothetical protein
MLYHSLGCLQALPPWQPLLAPRAGNPHLTRHLQAPALEASQQSHLPAALALVLRDRYRQH